MPGCHYTSYLAGIGKAAFLNAFYQYSDFITGSKQEGSLSDNSNEFEIKSGFLSLIRLIGTFLFKKHLSAFVALRCVQTPVQLFNSLAGHTIEERHELWYGNIQRMSVTEYAVKTSELLHTHHFGGIGSDHAGWQIGGNTRPAETCLVCCPSRRKRMEEG